MADPQADSIFGDWLKQWGFGDAEKTDPNSPKAKIMRDILATKTLYDAQFDSVQAHFAPYVQYLDGDKKRTVLFIDPMKLQSAQAYGIQPTEFLAFALEQKGLKTDPYFLRQMFNKASEVTGTDPCAIPVIDALHQNIADVIIPKSHMRQLQLDIPGLKPSEITTLVNYHEFFHCLHDKYAANHMFTENTPQKREMFADTGAMIEMMRRGSGPEIVDQMIIWRMRGKDDTHATIPALLALKKHMQEHGGVEGIRALKTSQVLDLCYKATEEGSKTDWKDNLQNFMKSMPDLKLAAAKAQSPNIRISDFYSGRDAAKILEDRAFAMGGRITPKSLMLANNALQKEYADQHEREPNNLKPMFQAGFTEAAYMQMVQGTDYLAANSKRGVGLTAEDIQDISFVQKKPLKVAAVAPAARH